MLTEAAAQAFAWSHRNERNYFSCVIFIDSHGLVKRILFLFFLYYEVMLILLFNLFTLWTQIESDNKVLPVYSMNAEFSRPLWVFGISSYQLLQSREQTNLIACTYR